ncbi:putative mitochondrial protein, partial [Mucuna pruriens]
MEEKESIANYFDRIQLVNAMRACKENVTDQQVVDKILRTLPLEFDYGAATIEELKDLNSMEVEELQHSLEAHEIRINKRRSTQEQALQARPNYNGKGEGPWKMNKLNTNQDQGSSETIFNKASVVRRPLQLKDQVLFYNSAVNSKGELIHSTLIAEAEPVFDKVVIEEKWLKTMKEEINSIEKNKACELVDPPSNKKPIALKWVYKVKVNQRGEVVKNKARRVAKGFLQKAGIDYGEVYALVARIETIRLVVAITTNAN